MKKTGLLKAVWFPIFLVRVIWAVSSGIPFRLLEIGSQIFPESSWGCWIRGLIYRPFLKKCGRNFQVALNAKLEHLHEIEVGNDVYIGHGSWVSGLRGGVCLDDEVMLGPFVKMIASNHRFENGSARFAKGQGEHISIGKGTWIASGAIVMAGVTVGESCLLAAGCVVTKDVPDHTIVMGVPARAIETTTDCQAAEKTSDSANRLGDV